MSEQETRRNPLDSGIVRMAMRQRRAPARWTRRFVNDELRAAQTRQRVAVFGLLGACLDALNFLDMAESKAENLPVRLRLQDAVERALGAGFRVRRRSVRYSMPVHVGQVLPEVMEGIQQAWRDAQEPRRCMACGQVLTDENCEDPARSDTCFCGAGL